MDIRAAAAESVGLASHDPVSLYQFTEWGLTTNEVLRPGQTRQGGKQHQETCPDPEEKLEMTT